MENNLFYLLLFCLQVIPYVYSQIVISSVSQRPGTYVASTGSFYGGTLLYVNGSGFGSDPTQINVLIGQNICDVDISATQSNFIACRIRMISNYSNYYNLPISVTVGSINATMNTPMCSYTYSLARTPIVEEIYPKSAIPTQTVYLFGLHRVSSTAQMIQILIDNHICSYNMQLIDGKNRNPISFTMVPTLVTGQYDLQYNSTVGYTSIGGKNYQTSYFTNRNYTNRVLSKIKSLSSHQSGIMGHKITLKGLGFSSNISEYTCKAAGQSCHISSANFTSLTIEIPPLSVDNLSYGRLTKDPLDLFDSSFPFLMSNGALYRRYTYVNLNKTNEEWLMYLRGTHSLILQQQKIITQLSSPEINGNNYIEIIKGYFFAPISGNYTFNSVCDDQCLMKMSFVQNTSNPDYLQSLFSWIAPSSNHFNSFVKPSSGKGNTTEFLERGYHYFEMLNIDIGNEQGYFKVMIEMPSFRNNILNGAWHMEKITIKPSFCYSEILQFEVYAASGSFNIFYYEANGSLFNITVPVGASANIFQGLLVNLPNIYNYQPTVTLITLDAFGNPSNSSIQGYQYKVGLALTRINKTLPNVNGSSLVQGSVARRINVTTLTDQMSGTFKMFANGKLIRNKNTLSFPYNLDAYTFKMALGITYSTVQTVVYKIIKETRDFSLDFVVQYVGLYQSAFPITFDFTNLNPGKAGAYIQVSVETIRQYSGRELYSPLPYDFLHVASEAPTLQISVKSIPALCSDCSFQYMPALTPLVTTAERSGNKYTISLSDPGLINFTLSDVTVTMFNVSCSGLTGTISNFSCYLPINADGSAALPAGSGLPAVLVSQIGHSDCSALPNETIPLIVTNILPGQSSLIGGDETTMTGSGFPISSAIGLSILVCGNQVTNFTLISNQILKFIIPPETVLCNGSNNIISYNGESTSFAIYYNPCLLPGDSVRCGNMYNTSDLSRDSFLRLWSNASQWPNQMLPQDGQDVMIPQEWNLILDIDPPILNFVEIYGVLNFDRGRDNLFRAQYIWVRQGGIIRIGSEELPFANRAQIILYGSQNGVRLVVDSKVQGNKIMVVTGGLQFYGSLTQSSWTTLSATTSVGGNQISVSSSAGWKVGDQIVIAPSYANQNQFQQVSITSINGNLIVFEPPLLYEHFGAANATIDNQYGVLDARSAVGVLNRNIKISADISNNDWGCRVLIYGFFDSTENMWKSGYAKMQGVEFVNCGQYNSTEAGLKIHNVGNANNGIVTIIKKSVFRNCLGICFSIKESSNLQISNNLFFNGLKYLVFVEGMQNQFTFTGNLLVGVFKSDKFANFGNNNDDQVAAYKQSYSTSLLSGITVNVKRNLVQGSEGGGFVLPMTTCSQISSYPFANNTAGSCSIGFIFQSLSNLEGECVAAKGGSAYASEVGLMVKLMGSQLARISNMVLADNAKAVNFNLLDQQSRNKLIFTESYVAGVSRLNCPNCYSQHKLKYCQQALAVFISSVSSSIASINVTVSSEVETDNVLFENFFFLNSNFSYCSRMSIFGRPSANSSIVSSFFLRNTSTRNCENQSWVNFQLTSVETQQCQTEPCFGGNNNCFIFDQDGVFTGQESQILGNNSAIANNEPVCHNIEFTNSHWCHTDSFAILEFQSDLWDSGQGDIWPVDISYQDGQWNSTANVLKSVTVGTNYQQTRFQSVVKLNETISIRYSSPRSYQQTYRLQRNSFSQHENSWVVVRLSCIPGASYRVSISNTSLKNHHIEPIIKIGGEAVDLVSHEQNCGANFYNSSTNQISVLIVQGDCVVHVKFRSALKLILFMNICLEDFISENISDFVKSVLANQLQIDENRISVIKVEERSPQIQNQIKIEIILSLSTDYRLLASQKAGIMQSEKNEMKKMQLCLQQGLAEGIIEGMLSPYFISFSFLNFTQHENSEKELHMNDIKIFAISITFFISLCAFIVATKCSERTEIKMRNCKNLQDEMNTNLDLNKLNREKFSNTTQVLVSPKEPYISQGNLFNN